MKRPSKQGSGVFVLHWSIILGCFEIESIVQIAQPENMVKLVQDVYILIVKAHIPNNFCHKKEKNFPDYEKNVSHV